MLKKSLLVALTLLAAAPSALADSTYAVQALSCFRSSKAIKGEDVPRPMKLEVYQDTAFSFPDQPQKAPRWTVITTFDGPVNGPGTHAKKTANTGTTTIAEDGNVTIEMGSYTLRIIEMMPLGALLDQRDSHGAVRTIEFTCKQER